jgi:protein ImuA
VSESSALIAELRRIAAAGSVAPADVRAPDAWLTQGLAPAQFHEIVTPDAVDAPSATGFAVATTLAARANPLLWIRTEASERQGGRLHATGLLELGLPADSLLLVVVADDAALLRTAADAARCAGLGAVLLESWGRAPGLDLTATRRLMLAAEASGVTVLSVRVGAEPVPSAAATRWSVTPAPSTPLEMDAPGGPAFQVELLRRRGGPAGQRWCVEWNRDAKSFSPIALSLSDTAPLSGAGLPLAADRAAAHHPPAPVRRTG